MLAEPKRRTIWSLNPRGKQWSEDKTKFGQKMLESMGWTEGKGLGKHQNGIQQHIKVGVNLDNKGLGYKATADDVWIDKNNDYETLLANLALHHNHNNISIGEEKVSNLEEISRRMKNRVHYNKLIKAKNLSQCSEKDLISIFPKKRDNSEKNDSESNGCQSVPQVNGNTFESSKSIADYFRSKMDKIKIKSELFNKINSTEDEVKDIQLCEDINEENDVLNEEQNTFNDNKRKLHEISGNSDNSGLDSIDINVCQKKSKKTKRKKEEKLELNLNESNFSLDFDNQLTTEVKTKTNKSKKRKKSNKNKNECNDSNDSQSETSFNDTNSESKEVVTKSSHSTDSMKKRHKKTEKNIEKYKLKVPKGYDKNTVSVSESLKNYHKMIVAIESDRALNTTNLMSLKGYGCHSD